MNKMQNEQQHHLIQPITSVLALEVPDGITLVVKDKKKQEAKCNAV